MLGQLGIAAIYRQSCPSQKLGHAGPAGHCHYLSSKLLSIYCWSCFRLFRLQWHISQLWLKAQHISYSVVCKLLLYVDSLVLIRKVFFQQMVLVTGAHTKTKETHTPARRSRELLKKQVFVIMNFLISYNLKNTKVTFVKGSQVSL